MQQVAERAGVSVTTVSHVINETRPVSDELRERVLAVVAELGYQPNVLARSLRRGETHTIGAIIPDNANPFFAEVVRGVEDTSFEQGYSVILCNSDGDPDKELHYANVLVEKRVDGILLIAAGVGPEHILAWQKQHIPLVLIDRDIPDVSVDVVLTHNARGGWLAARHLIELGHQRIGCIAGPSDMTPSDERLAGYLEALRESGLSADETLVLRGDFQCQSGYQAGHQILSKDDPPTAIFACNDLMAMGAMRAALELGLRIPGDLSVMGFDDIPLASFINPPLTTIQQPKYEMGVLAASLLLERMQDPDMPPHKRTLETHLVVRESSGAAHP
jgi:LacI family transcriptional regulator